MKKQDSQIERNEAWTGFLNLCTQFKTPGELERFFDLFFTLEEKEALKGRYLVVKALEEGKLTQREIAEQYHVSISQITRGSNALKVIDSPLKEELKNHFDSWHQ